MKRVLWFLALFAVGLGVLLWFESKRKHRAAAPLVTSNESPPAPPPGSVPEGPSGHFVATRLDQSNPALARRAWKLDFEDLSYDAQASEFRATRSQIDRFDPESGDTTATLLARSARIPSVQGERPGAYELGSKLTLRDVDATLQQGGSLGPLRLLAAELSGDIDAQRFWTPGKAAIRGKGVESSGEGLRIEIAESKLTYDSRARVTLELGARGSLELTSDGPLEIVSAPKEAGGLLTVHASRRARIEGTGLASNDAAQRAGAEPVALGGDSLTVIALPGADGALVMQQIDAQGLAKVERGAWRADGEHAHIVFGPDGRPTELRVDGAPTAHIPLQGVEAARAAEAVWTGAGPLVASGNDPVVLAMAGPTRIQVLEHELRAASELRAFLPRDAAQPRRLVAEGGVELDSHGWRLGAPHVEATLREVAPRELAIDAETVGTTSMQPIAADQQGRSMRAQRGARIHVSGSTWTIPLARSAEIFWNGAHPLEARATEVLDFDPRGPSFRAEGSFVLVSGTTTASGARATVRDLDHAFVEGTSDAPALLERPGDRISALFVERDGDTLRARGEIDALHEEAGVRQSVLADELELVRNEQLDAHGALLRHVEMRSRGSVRASLHDPRSSADIVCTSLTAIADVIEPAAGAGSTETQRASSFEALGVVQSRLELGPDTWELACGRLTGSGVTLGKLRDIDALAKQDDALRDSRLDAWGGVAFARSGPLPLRGRAEHLSLVGRDHALLEPKPGERVHAEGVLGPDTKRVYSVDADSLAFDGGGWNAQRPLVWLFARAPDGTFTFDANGAELSRMSADRFRYEPPLALLDGNAAIRGKTQDGEDFDFEASHMRAVLAESGATSIAQRIEGLTASGGFRVRYGEILRAQGEEFSSQRGPTSLRMTGNPVNVEWLGIAFTSAWVEVDLALRALRTGKFTAHPGATTSRGGRP